MNRLFAVLACVFAISTIVAVVMGIAKDSPHIVLIGVVIGGYNISIGVTMTIARQLRKETVAIREEIKDLRKSLKGN